MIAYVDSSILLRVALNQKGRLPEFSSVSVAGSSRILKVECLRSVDRLHSLRKISRDDLLSATEFIYEALDRLEIIYLVDTILERASEPTGLTLGTLDAIHLFSAVEWRRQKEHPVSFLTHDVDLGRAAKLFGFEVLGV